MSTRKDNSVWTVLCCRVKETTHVSTRKQLAQMFWTDSESAMIMKLFRGHCLRPHRWSHLGDASHAAPERTHHPISHCSTTCPYPLWAVILCSPCLNLRASWGPLNAPDSRSQSRTQRTIQACTATVSYPSSMLLCASCRRLDLFQISGALFSSLAFVLALGEESTIPAQAISCQLLPSVSNDPDFRPCLNILHSTCLLFPEIKVSSLNSPLL